MKIKVLQGINLVNPMTTVVAEMKDAKPDLLNFFLNLHPIFLKSFNISSKSKNSKNVIVEIQTNLPNIWKSVEVLDALESHALKNLSLEKAKEQILESATLALKSMSTIPTLYAAHDLGLETYPFLVNSGVDLKMKGVNRRYCIGIGKESAVSISAASSGDSNIAYRTQRDKAVTNQFIENMGIPIAHWAEVESKSQIKELTKKIGFPLVMKPVGLTGGHAVFVGIKSIKEAEKTYDKIKQEISAKGHSYANWQKKIIIQKMISGEDYRMLVINGKLEIATHRIPARVTGDGRHNIQELIEQENNDPQRDTKLPTHTLKPITIDDQLVKVIKEQGFELTDIPEKDKTVQVRKVASMSQGGITADVTDKVHPQIKYICESIAESIHANVLGIDILCEDLSKPLTSKNGSILEFNTMPEIYLNTHPVIGKKYPKTGYKIIKGIIDPKVHTNRIVAIGEIGDEKIEDIINKNIKNPGKIGSFKNKTIFINRYPVSLNNNTQYALLALKRNRSLDSILCHYSKITEIKDNGLGFDSIDLLVLSKDITDSIKTKLEDYQNANLIKNIVQL